MRTGSIEVEFHLTYHIMGQVMEPQKAPLLHTLLVRFTSGVIRITGTLSLGT